MIVTEGGRFGGYGLFLNKGKLDIGRGKVNRLTYTLGPHEYVAEKKDEKPQ